MLFLFVFFLFFSQVTGGPWVLGRQLTQNLAKILNHTNAFIYSFVYFSSLTSQYYVYKVLYFSRSSIFFLSNSFLFSILLDLTRIVWISRCKFSVRSWSCNTANPCSPMLVCDLDSLFGAERLIRRNRLRDWVLRNCWSFPRCSTGTFK